MHMLPAILLIGASWMAYAQGREDFRFPRWQVHHFDHADFRYLAERFWGQEHDMQTYAQEFQEAWGGYLDIIPFREIGVGSYYLVVRAVTGFVTGAENMRPENLAFAIPFSMQLLLAGSYLLLYTVCRRIWGMAPALIVLACMVLPLGIWTITEELLSEPLLRICFVLLLASLLPLTQPGGKHRGSILLFLLVTFCMVHLKSHYMLLALLVLPALLLPRRHDLPLIAASIAIVVAMPLSLIAVHKLGWDVYSGANGFGPYVSFRTNGRSLAYACDHLQGNDGMSICDAWRNGEYMNGFWQFPFPPQATAADYLAIDGASRVFLLSDPIGMITTLVTELRHVNGFEIPPPRTGFPAWLTNLFLLLNILTIGILAVGVCARRTAPIACYGLALLAVPWLMSVLVYHLPKYYSILAVLPFAIAILVLWPPLLFPAARVRD
jgi:hypothetical protein